MKKHLLALLAVTALAVSVQAQTINTNDPVSQGVEFATAPGATNFMAIGYGAYSSQERLFGGGVALTYEAPQAQGWAQLWGRFERIGGNMYQGFGGAALKPPTTLVGKWPAIPFGLTGMSVGLNGQNSWAPVSHLGTGLYVKLYKNWGLTATVEWANGGPYKWDRQYRGGLSFSW